MSTQTINISLPQELVKKIDRAAKAEFASRSDYIRQALVGKLRADKTRDQADEWELLESLMNDAAEGAQKNGYATNEDFVRAVKEVRREKLKSMS
jgi:metal-responsive CopG/Arc/MetJ family transcriptional regulator